MSIFETIHSLTRTNAFLFELYRFHIILSIEYNPKYFDHKAIIICIFNSFK